MNDTPKPGPPPERGPLSRRDHTFARERARRAALTIASSLVTATLRPGDSLDHAADDTMYLADQFETWLTREHDKGEPT